jgi:hypothetical protein
MLAKGHWGVNGKCVLVCTMVEMLGSKITQMTNGHVKKAN